MQIIDTHTHGYFHQFDSYREEMLVNARRAGVIHQIQIGCDEISSLAAVQLAEKYADCSATIGLHPCDVAPLFEKKFQNYRLAGFDEYQRKAQNLDELFEFFEDLYQKSQEKIVGIGETGFDRYHDSRECLVEWQAESFRKHLEMAKKYSLPIVIHTRNSTKELFDFLEKSQEFFTGDTPVRGVVHCFCEDLKTAEVFVEKYGLSLGIGGIATYSNTAELAETIQKIPEKFLLTETDAPFLAPRKFRKENSVNDPSSLPEVVERIAELRNTDSHRMAEVLVENAKQLFGV